MSSDDGGNGVDAWVKGELNDDDVPGRPLWTMSSLSDSLRRVEFIQAYTGEIEAVASADDKDFELDLTALDKYDEELVNDIINNPGRLETWEAAIENHPELVELASDEAFVDNYSEAFETADVDMSPVDYEVPEDVRVVPVNPPERMYVDIGGDRLHAANKLVAIEGVVSLISAPKPRITELEARCLSCNTLQDSVDTSWTYNLDAALSRIGECKGCESSRVSFEVDYKYSTLQPHQLLRLQESPEDARNPANPRDITVDVLGRDYQDVCQSGDRVTIIAEMSFDKDGDRTLSEINGEAYHIIPEQSSRPEDIDVSEEEEEMFQLLADRPDLFELMTDSIASDIKGRDAAKLGGLLQLFGGVTRESKDSRIRGDIHVFYIGEPSTGKSDIKKSLGYAAPFSVDASGSTATSVGLTASAEKVEVGGETQWTAEPGAIVLADGGLLTVDEFDKLSDEHKDSLNDALSGGEFSFNKAGINTTLKARTSALMVANPEDKVFHPEQSYSDQFNVDPDVLSRFDLVFVFDDQPDPEIDDQVSHAVLDAHAESESAGGEEAAADGGEAYLDETGRLDLDVLRRYIAYARATCEPSLKKGTEAYEHLDGFYKMLRNASTRDSKFKARKFHGVVRLAEASAKARLSDTVELEDAERATDLMMTSLRQMASDPETDELDFSRLWGDEADSFTQRKKRVRDLVQDLMGDCDDDHGVKAASVVDVAEDEDLGEETVRNCLQKLTKTGRLIEEGGRYRVNR